MSDTSANYNQVIEFLNSRRFFCFKNKNNIILDKETGLLWADIPQFRQNDIDMEQAKKQLRKYDFGFPSFRIPNKEEICALYKGGNPLQLGTLRKVATDGSFKTIGDIVSNKRITPAYTHGYFFPCSDYLSQKYLKGSPESLLSMLLENDLTPFSDFPSIVKAYEFLKKEKTVSNCQIPMGIDHKDRKEQILNSISEIEKKCWDLKFKIMDALAKANVWIYSIQGNEKVIWDRNTGLLWQDFDSVTNEYIDKSNAKEELAKLDLGFRGMRLPKESELKDLYGSGYLDNQYKANKTTRILTSSGPKILDSYRLERLTGVSKTTSQSDGYLLPCSDILFEKVKFTQEQYAKISSEKKEYIEWTYVLLNENGIVPVFNNKKLDELCKLYYIEKPALEKELEAIKRDKKSQSAAPPKPVAFSIDAWEILSQYDLGKISSSLYEYCDNVGKLCSSLTETIEDYEKNNAELLENIKKISEHFSGEYIRNDLLSDEENAEFAKGREIISAYCAADLENNKLSLKAIAAEADKLRERLDEAACRFDAVAELGRIESEPHASFVLLAESSIRAINDNLNKINSFAVSEERIVYLAETYEKELQERIDFASMKRGDYITNCEKEYIDKEMAEKWCDEILRLSILRLEVFVFVLKRYLFDDAYTGSDKACKGLCGLLAEHGEKIWDFYVNSRIGVYQKFAFASGGELLDRIETERGLYEATSDFRKKLCELVCDASEEEAKLIIDCTDELCDAPLTHLIALTGVETGGKISAETIAMLEELRKSNFDAMKKDAKYFAEEQMKRDKEFNSLLFKMQKEVSGGVRK